MTGNGAEVKKALEDLRAELSEKDIAAIDEALKERGIDVKLVMDPAVPEGAAVMMTDDPTKLIHDEEFLNGRRKAAVWIKNIADPEKHIREIRGDEHE